MYINKINKILLLTFCFSFILCGAEKLTPPPLNLTEVKRGIVFFTFDDRHFKHWVESIPVFRKYDAYATFFFSGKIDAQAVNTMKILQQNGHAVGLHSLKHKNAPDYVAKHGAEKYLKDEIIPQLELCRKSGLDIRYFAYPNNRRTPETDALLGRYFKRLRAGCGLPKKVSLTDHESFYRNIDELKKSPVMPGAGIGKFYNSTDDMLKKVLEKAAQNNSVIVFFSHDIGKKVNKVSITTQRLEMCLKHAQALGMKIASFDQIP